MRHRAHCRAPRRRRGDNDLVDTEASSRYDHPAPRSEDVMPTHSFRLAASLFFFLLAIYASPARSDDGHWTLTALEQDGPNTWVDVGLVLGDPIPLCTNTTCLPEGHWHLFMSPCPLQVKDSHCTPQCWECNNGVAQFDTFRDVAQPGRCKYRCCSRLVRIRSLVTTPLFGHLATIPDFAWVVKHVQSGGIQLRPRSL